MQVPFLDIPSGLEEAYFKVVQFARASTQNRIILRRSSPARKNYYKVALRSLFVQLAPGYDLLADYRHVNWTIYWLTLPFGNHIGSNGWPGSGFSAFVYWNAPRLRAGLPLDLDPPIGANFFLNPSFTDGLTYWFISSLGASVYDGALAVEANSDPEGSIQQNFAVNFNPGTYRFSFRINVPPLNIAGDGAPVVHLFMFINPDMAGEELNLGDLGGLGWQTITRDIVITTEPISLGYGQIYVESLDCSADTLFDDFYLTLIA